MPEIWPARRARLAAAAVAFGTFLAIPATAAARTPPNVVAWHVMQLANTTLSSTGTPAAQLIKGVVCSSRRYPRYVCRASFGDGSQVVWKHVTLTDAGQLDVGADSVV